VAGRRADDPVRAALAPGIVAAAGAVHEVPAGWVDEIAGDLLGAVRGELLVALGGGRVIDTAKALVGSGALPGTPRAAAIPTTLSAAEMTHVHRGARGAPDPRLVRPAIVLNDPAVCASQPEAELAASAGNALAHAIEGPLTTHASPVPSAAAAQARALLATGFPQDGPVDREALALGALLSGYTIDSTHYGLHHVMSQTLVRVAGAGHGPANTALLPHTARALSRRSLGGVSEDDLALADRLALRSGATSLEAIGVDRGVLEACAQAASSRAELAFTPPRATAEELLEIYAAVY
jgi:alcohol dehydrogenase class IV